MQMGMTGLDGANKVQDVSTRLEARKYEWRGMRKDLLMVTVFKKKRSGITRP
jgi:hypothetical protein